MLPGVLPALKKFSSGGSPPCAVVDRGGVPTVVVYRDSIRVFVQAGALPRPELDDLIAQVRSLDMEQVRAQVDAHELGHVHH